jgi:hypothetical protein
MVEPTSDTSNPLINGDPNNSGAYYQQPYQQPNQQAY